MPFRARVLACPSCSADLAPLKGAAKCIGCGGVWVEEGELVERVRIVRGQRAPDIELAAVPEARPTKGPCPMCREPLDAVSIGDQAIDRCASNHGLWFDAEELARVLYGAARTDDAAGSDDGLGLDALDLADGAGLVAKIAAFIAMLFD